MRTTWTPAGEESNLMNQNCSWITDEEEEDLFQGPFNEFALKGFESHLGDVWKCPLFMNRASWKVSGFRIDSPLIDTWTTALAINRTFHNLHSFAITVGGQVVVYPHGCERTFNTPGPKCSIGEAWKAFFPIFWRITSATGNFIGVPLTSSHVRTSNLIFSNLITAFRKNSIEHYH